GQALHDRADGVSDACAGAFFAVDHTLAEVAGENVVTLVEALGHARDLFANVLDGLGAANFDGADTLFEAFGEASDLQAHAVEPGGFAALDLVEALLKRRRHARELFTHGGSRSVVV